MRNKRQSSFVFKGLILVLAFALTLIYMPLGSVMSLVRAATNYTDYNYMTIGTQVDEVSVSATKGVRYDIAAGYVGGDPDKVVGRMAANSDLGTGVTLKTSTVTVKYSSKVIGQIKDDEEVEDADGNKLVEKSTTAGCVAKFTPDKQGEYTIVYSYTYTKDSVDYTNAYELVVTSTLTEADFNFDNNTDVILPAHIDLKLAKVGNTYKDMYLPLPEVTGEDGKVQTAGTDYTITTNEDTAQGDATKNYLVVTGRAAGSAVVAIEKDNETDALYVTGAEIANRGAGEYTFTYKYYEKGQFVVSTTKTTKLHSETNPYYTDYKLELDLASSFAQNAGETGVEKSLPAAKGVTASTTKPASESVDVHYSVKVLYKKNASDSYAELNATTYADVLDEDGNLKDPTAFKPLEDGSYTFVYTITDYYGNTKTTAVGKYHWEDVVDGTNPTPVIYDAAAYDEEEGYVDATKLIPTNVMTKNVIVYAIGMNDNHSKVGDEGVTLTRKIALSNSSQGVLTTEVTIENYNEYNLIFAFDTTDTLVANNYRLALQLDAAGVDKDDEAAVLAWLKQNHYLIVTADSTKTIADGYAYIDTETTFGTLSKTYTIYYTAKDASGNVGETTKTLRVNSSIVDDQDPVVKFPTTLADRYLPTATITFDAPSVTDTNRTSYLAEKVLYRMTDSHGDYIEIADAKTLTIGAKKYVDITNDDANTYSIDLSKGEGVTNVEILVYAYDDFGNRGEYTEIVSVSTIDDQYAPVLGHVEAENGTYKTDSTIALPVVVVDDDQAGYLTYNVNVTYTDAEGETHPYYVENTSRKKEVNEVTGAGRLTLTAGTFNPQYAGTYQASIAVRDCNNTTIVVFSHYTVTSRGAVVQSPKLRSTLASESVDLKDNPVITLPTPTVSFELEDSVTYDEYEAGVSTETYVVRGISKDGKAQGYETTYGEEGSFTPEVAGNYDLVYSLDVVAYAQAKFEYKELTFVPGVGTTGNYYVESVSGDENVVAYENGVYTITSEDGTKTGTVSKDENGAVVKNLNDFGTALDSIDWFEDFRVYHLESDVVTISVTDNRVPTLPEMDYKLTMTTEEFENDGITFHGIESLDGLNVEKSSYRISWKLADGTNSGLSARTGETALTDYTLTKGTVTTTGNVDGTYTITYTVVGINGKSTTKTYSIIVGDNQAPEITFPDKFVESSYEIGQTLRIDTADIVVTDGDSGIEDGSLSVTLVNTSTSETIEMTKEGSVYTYQFNKEDSIGNYTLTVTVEDKVGNTAKETFNFEVTAKNRNTTPVYQIVGIILIVISVLVLVGVVVYFIVSKVKLDKELKK